MTTTTAQGDEIEGLRAWLREPDYAEDGFSLADAISWINRRPLAEFERAATEFASLRERLAKAEEKSAAWHRFALDIGVERDEARDRALAAESRLAEAKRAFGDARDDLNMYRGAGIDDVVAKIEATLAHLGAQETTADERS